MTDFKTLRERGGSGHLAIPPGPFRNQAEPPKCHGCDGCGWVTVQ